MKRKSLKSSLKIFIVFFILLFLLNTSGCSARQPSSLPLYSGGSARYIFFFIGDGMGKAQRTAAEIFLKEDKGKDAGLLMNSFPYHGMTETHAANWYITDSAAAGTALACGKKTNIGYISLGPDLSRFETLGEIAEKQGRKTGIITSVPLNHASPACFYAHQPSRKRYYEISMELSKSGFDFFAGGGFIDSQGKNARVYSGNVIETAVSRGYVIINDKPGFMNLKPGSGKAIIFPKSISEKPSLAYDIDNEPDKFTLAEFTQKAIEILENEKGFFIMVEGGKIDWACHMNDAASAVREVIAFDNALKEAYDFYEKHPEETLIVVTGDHETGGLAVDNPRLNILARQACSAQYFTDHVIAEYKEKYGNKGYFNDMIPLVEKYFGLRFSGEGSMVLNASEIEELKKAFARTMAGSKWNDDIMGYVRYGKNDPFSVSISRIIGQRAGLSWTSFSHTNSHVITSAIGKGAETFEGYYDNTDIARKIKAVMGVNAQ